MIRNFRMPRPIENIKNQLSDFSEVKAVTNFNYREDLASIFYLDTMIAHENELLRELEAAEWLEKNLDFEFVIKGDFIKNKAAIDIVLIELTSSIENLRTYIYELVVKELESNSNIANKILVKNLILKKDLLTSIFEVSFQYIVSPAISYNYSRVFEIIFLSLLSIDDEIDVLNIIPMTSRFRTYYFDLLDLIINNQLIMNTRTKCHPFIIELSPENARVRKEAVEKICIDLRDGKEEIIAGLLMMFGISKKSFLNKN
jgi:hypothetical protein